MGYICPNSRDMEICLMTIKRNCNILRKMNVEFIFEQKLKKLIKKAVINGQQTLTLRERQWIVMMVYKTYEALCNAHGADYHGP